MSCLSKFIAMVTSSGEIDLGAFHSLIGEVINANGECARADVDDIENIKNQFFPETAALVSECDSHLRWLSQILINQCVTHVDDKRQHMLLAFLDRLLSTESEEYLTVLYAAKRYFSKVSELLQSAPLGVQAHRLVQRLHAHQLTENHANKAMAFLKARSSDVYANERLSFLKAVEALEKKESPLQGRLMVKDAQGLCTPFALMAMCSLSVAEFIRYVNAVMSQSGALAHAMIVTSFHRDMLYQQLDRLVENNEMGGAVSLLGLFRFIGMGVDVQSTRGHDVLMAFFSQRLLQAEKFASLLTAFDISWDQCFEIYHASAPEKRLGPVDEAYLVFLKNKYQRSSQAVFDHLTKKEKETMPAMLYYNVAHEAGLNDSDIFNTFTEAQTNAFMDAIVDVTENNQSLVTLRDNLLGAHARGVDLGELECRLLNTLPNLDKEMALFLFTSKALQAQSRAYVVSEHGVRNTKEELSYEGLNRIIFTALLALDPDVYQRPGNESLGFTSFEEAFKYWMITMVFQHRDHRSYENAIFHDNFQSKSTASVGDDDRIYLTSDPRGFMRQKLCTDKALEARLKAAKVNDTPETLAQNTPVDHGQIAAMLALKKIRLHYDRHGVKHAFQAILDMRPRLKNAICDHALLDESHVPGLNLLENILMSHESSEILSPKTKQYKALLAVRKRQPPFVGVLLAKLGKFTGLPPGGARDEGASLVVRPKK